MSSLKLRSSIVKCRLVPSSVSKNVSNGTTEVNDLPAVTGSFGSRFRMIGGLFSGSGSMYSVVGTDVLVVVGAGVVVVVVVVEVVASVVVVVDVMATVEGSVLASVVVGKVMVALVVDGVVVCVVDGMIWNKTSLLAIRKIKKNNLKHLNDTSLSCCCNHLRRIFILFLIIVIVFIFVVAALGSRGACYNTSGAARGRRIQILIIL